MAHNQEDGGSSPPSATNNKKNPPFWLGSFFYKGLYFVSSRKIKIIIIVVLIVLCLTLTLLLSPYFKYLASEDGLNSFKNTIDETGVGGWLVFIAIQFVQVIIAFIPGEPVEILGGFLFGSVIGSLLCLVGSFLGTTAVYYLVKVIGKPLVGAFVNKKVIKKHDFLNNEKKLELVVFILFLIPGTPKDILTYIVPLTKIEPMKFFVLSTIARIPSVVSSVVAGASLGEEKYMLSIIIFIITGIIGAGGIIINNHFISNKN